MNAWPLNAGPPERRVPALPNRPQRGRGRGEPAAPYTPPEDVFNDPQVTARGMIMPVEDPEFGSVGFARSPPHLSAAPELPANRAPNLGQHTREILQDLLGYTPADVDRLAAEGVVQTDGG